MNNKYMYNSRENRFKEIIQIWKNPEVEILVIHKPSGQPFCGIIKGWHQRWDVLGKQVITYDVWLEEIGKLIKASDPDYYTFSSGYF